jgi:hypothetical protein
MNEPTHEAPDSSKNTVPALLTAFAALLTALAAFLHKPEETDAKATYEELSKSLAEVSQATTQNYKDIASLRGYLDGLARAPLVTPTSTATPPSVTSPSPSPTPFSSPLKILSGGSASPKSPRALLVGTSASDAGVFVPLLPAPPPPTMAPAPHPFAPRAFDAVTHGPPSAS